MSCQVTDMAHVGTDTGFAGLPRGTQAFLRDLEARNDRGWFEANRARYETDWLAPARALIAALATPCAVLEPPLRAEPKINGSIPAAAARCPLFARQAAVQCAPAPGAGGRRILLARHGGPSVDRAREL
jgi:hypothetical protein